MRPGRSRRGAPPHRQPARFADATAIARTATLATARLDTCARPRIWGRPPHQPRTFVYLL
ncbi:hypothetical protein ACWDOR_00085 [Streptosporangium canum]